MNLYVTDTEIKNYLGISGSGQDTKIAMMNKSATERVNRLLSVSDLAFHKVTEEVHDAIGKKIYALRDMHVQSIGTILDDTTEYTQDEEYDIENYLLRLEDSLWQGKRKGKITYSAGWNAGGYTTLTVTDYSSIASADTIAIDPGGAGAETLTEGTDWDAETSNTVTANNIADAINTNATLAGSSGVRAFSLGAVVYIIDRVPQRETSTVTLGTGTGLSLSATTMTGVDFPEDIREAIIYAVGAKLSIGNAKGITRYRIGSKEVTYQTERDIDEQLKKMLRPYMRAVVKTV